MGASAIVGAGGGVADGGGAGGSAAEGGGAGPVGEGEAGRQWGEMAKKI